MTSENLPSFPVLVCHSLLSPDMALTITEGRDFPELFVTTPVISVSPFAVKTEKKTIKNKLIRKNESIVTVLFPLRTGSYNFDLASEVASVVILIYILFHL